LRFHLGKHQGSYPAWWRQIRLEIYGWLPHEHTARLDGKSIDAEISSYAGGLALTIPDNEQGELLELK
jgi:alpha-glucosidase